MVAPSVSSDDPTSARGDLRVAGFETEDGPRGIFGQSIRHDKSTDTAANDDVVKRVRRQLGRVPRVKFCPRRGSHREDQAGGKGQP